MKKSFGKILLAIVVIGFIGYSLSTQSEYENSNQTPEKFEKYFIYDDIFPKGSINNGFIDHQTFHVHSDDIIITYGSYYNNRADIVDISDPNSPSIVYSTSYGIFKISSYGDIIYAHTDIGDKKIDISDPTNPIDTPTDIVYDIFYKDIGLAFDYNKFTPTNISSQITYDTIWLASDYNQILDLIVQDDLLVIMDVDGIQLWNLTNAPNITMITTIEPPSYMQSMELHENILAFSDNLGYYFYNISDPVEPVLLARHDDYVFKNMEIEGSIMYAIKKTPDIDPYAASILCFDISNLQNLTLFADNNGIIPKKIAFIQNSLFALGIEASFTYEDNVVLYSLDTLITGNQDADNDGVNFHAEKWNYNSDPDKIDTDGDGMDDGYECKWYIPQINFHLDAGEDAFFESYKLGLIPTINDINRDDDFDELTNIQEYQLGSSPVDIDTDDDKIRDGIEVDKGLNILVPNAPEDYIDPMIIIALVGFVIAILLIWAESRGLGIKVAPLTIFLSHAVIDFEKYNLIEFVDHIDKVEAVDKTLYCEKDMRGNIDDWMDENVPISEIFVFVATQKTIFNSPDCAREVRLGLEHELFLIPIKTDEVTWDDLLNLNLPTSGFDYKKENPKQTYDEIKEYLVKLKANMDVMQKELIRENFAYLGIYDTNLEMKPGDATRLAKVLLAEQKLKGVLSKDGQYYLSNKEVKKRFKSDKEQLNGKTVEEMMDILGIAEKYIAEFKKIVKFKNDKKE